MLFHGYGADAADLAGLSREVPLEREVRWIFPEAPLALDFGGRAWFPIDVEEFERAQRTGKPADWSKTEPAGFAEGRRAAAEFIAALGVPWKNLVLGGFSQGAMIAADLALHAAEPPLGLIILSGILIKEQEWRRAAAKRSGLSFFQSHGIVDPLLSFQGAKKLEGVLQDGGLEGKLLTFEGGHSVTPEVCEALGRFLEGLPKSE